MISAVLIDHYCVRDGSNFRLADFNPGDTGGLDLKKQEAKELLESYVKRLADLQERLYADNSWAILVVLQGMDTSGKDGVIEHVTSGVNPQGCHVTSFKSPSEQELDHDYLWRSAMALPERGRIGVFNRSYYEETIVVRVHPEFLKAQHLPRKLITDDIWKERFKDIANFECYLARNGILPIKFFLYLSKEEQLKRLLARIDEPAKRWKFRAKDVEERKLWDQYIHAYKETIRHTATEHAPWYVVPADHKWFTRLVVAATLVERMEALNLKFPTLDEAAVRELERIRGLLEAEKS
jgi:PPK2 family polyphosphate:nucleotide phosphotransferase